MNPIARERAQSLIAFAPTEVLQRQGFAEAQLQGAVAAYNQLARNGIAYLADEVGMGKTYIALGVMGLLHHFNRDARVLVIAPRENLQRKWMKELSNFVQNNWLVPDNRVRSLQGTPAMAPTYVGSLRDLVLGISTNPDRDFFLRMTSFSIASNDVDRRREAKRALLDLLPWIPGDAIPTRDAADFRLAYGQALNAVLPEIDLLVVDEGHNLKHGFGSHTSTRNALLGSIFGAKGHEPGRFEQNGPRVKRLLFLSATPFESDYADLWRQLDLFGFGDARLTDAGGGDPLSVRLLSDATRPTAEKRRVVERFLMRRVSGLKIAGRKYTKNMYRREWRSGGLGVHDEGMAISDPKQRLIVALVQKKVAEVLGDPKFGRQFQIGMLCSFESFLESTTRGIWHEDSEPEDEERLEGEEDPAIFDGKQVVANGEGDDDPDEAGYVRKREREGVDAHALTHIVRTYRKRFGRSLPHPKLDATVEHLARSFDTGEKVLVFVRRIATMKEMKARLDERYNAWIRARMVGALPRLEQEISALFERFEAEHRRWEAAASEKETSRDTGADGRTLPSGDEGGRDSFFAWFFRGEGPPGVLSGAAFQRNRLTATSSSYSVLFEDDYVAWLFDRPSAPLEALARALGRPLQDLRAELRGRAWATFRSASQQKEGYPRLYVFEAYQAAALAMLHHHAGERSSQAGTILRGRFEGRAPAAEEPPPGFPDPEVAIGIVTLVTELAARPELEKLLLPTRCDTDFEQRFREREWRRELLSAMCRLGASYIDLYLLAIDMLGSFELRKGTETERPEVDLARRFADLLQSQRGRPGFHAYRELSQAAEAFEGLIASNFPEARNTPLPRILTLYANTLQRQSPVATSGSGALTRLVRQFRMPGYPLVLITTDILQEGEDLHTFCREVIHYGITWTPSGMEQRTGRVDRIGSLVQRRLDGRDDSPSPTEFLQVHYPYLKDTVEVLQVERVLERMNRFLRLMHKNLGSAEDFDRRVALDREMVALRRDVGAITEELESAFPVDPRWLVGEEHGEPVRRLDVPALGSHLEHVWGSLEARLGLDTLPPPGPFAREAIVPLEGDRVHRVRIELRSQTGGDNTLLRCTSPVGVLDLARDRDVAVELEKLQRDLGMVKVCISEDAKRRGHHVEVQGDIPFDPATTQPHEVEVLVMRTARAAHRIQGALLSDQVETLVPREQRRDMERLRGMAGALAAKRHTAADLSVEGDEIVARFHAAKRKHRVQLACVGGRCVLTSPVLTSERLAALTMPWEDIYSMIWLKNASTDLVTFALDAEEDLVGRVEHPIATLDATEFELFVWTLLRECDRLEFSLTGEDHG